MRSSTRRSIARPREEAERPGSAGPRRLPRGVRHPDPSGHRPLGFDHQGLRHQAGLTLPSISLAYRSQAMSLPNINQSFERVSAAVVASRPRNSSRRFSPTFAGRRGALHGRIKALRPSMKLAGPAFTSRGFARGDNLMIHAALALAQPGDIAGHRWQGRPRLLALMGTIMMNAARQRGLAGVVIDGAVRDSIELEEMQFPSSPWAPTRTARPSRGRGSHRSPGPRRRRDGVPG